MRDSRPGTGITRAGYVYILASQKNGTLYIGATRLVYIERHEHIVDAIVRKKAMKKWNRAWADLWTQLNQEARW